MWSGGKFCGTGESVLRAAQVAVILYRGLVEFVAPVVELAAMLAKGAHLFFGERFEAAKDFQILVKHLHAVHSRNGGGDARNTHRVGECFGGRKRTTNDRFA